MRAYVRGRTNRENRRGRSRVLVLAGAGEAPATAPDILPMNGGAGDSAVCGPGELQ
jgi:hypothetical protein